MISKWVVWYIHCKLEKVKLKCIFFLLLWFHPEDTWRITDAEFLLISEKAETNSDFFRVFQYFANVTNKHTFLSSRYAYIKCFLLLCVAFFYWMMWNTKKKAALIQILWSWLLLSLVWFPRGLDINVPCF